MRKLLIITASLLALTTTAQARDAEEVQTVCNAAAELASSIMAARQANVPFDDLITASREFDVPDVFKDVYRVMAVGAYEIPLETSETLSLKAIADFASSAHASCVDTIGD